MTWKDWLILGGGTALAPFTGGASLAGSGAIVSARQAGETADKANKQQQAGTNAANQALQPYLNIGSQAQNTLGQLMGFNPDVNGAVRLAPAGFHGGTVQDPRTETTLPITDLQPDARNHWQKLSDLHQQAKDQTASGFDGGGSSGGVRMRTPNGAIVIVPQAHVREAQMHGGQVI